MSTADIIKMIWPLMVLQLAFQICAFLSRIMPQRRLLCIEVQLGNYRPW